jgi:hypothetical protein
MVHTMKEIVIQQLTLDSWVISLRANGLGTLFSIYYRNTNYTDVVKQGMTIQNSHKCRLKYRSITNPCENWWFNYNYGV